MAYVTRKLESDLSEKQIIDFVSKQVPLKSQNGTHLYIHYSLVILGW